MSGRNGNLIEPGAYWLLYVVSFSGALLHWRLGNEFMAAVCGVVALLSAFLIGRVWINVAPQER
ncbi:hypothetical protein [Nocardiopsis oceani]